MADRYWDKGVELELHGIGRYRTVKSTEDAAECLLSRWPPKNGPAWIKAQKACLESLKKTTDRLKAEHARHAFIKAADEAGIYIRNRD
jgi:hypothetical protein